MPDKVLNTMLKHGGTQKPFSYVPTGMDLKKFKEKARQYVFIFQSAWWLSACADPEGGDRGSGSPLENYKNIGFLSNTGPDPLKITKLPNQHSKLGHHQHASGPMTARL